jgi:hypothetical protein
MHAVLFVYQRAFTPELIMQRPVRLRVGTPEFLGPVLRGPAVLFYRLLTKTPLPQPHVRSGRHYGNLLPSSPIIQRCGVRPSVPAYRPRIRQQHAGQNQRLLLHPLSGNSLLV